MDRMTPLFGYCHENPTLTAFGGLEQYVQTIKSQMMGQNAGAPVPRTPGMGQFPIGASPHLSHLPAPGSPHLVGSPAPGVMQAPGMHPSQSQQGNPSNGPSANNSPIGTKRRRPSGIKTEEDTNGGPTSAPAAPGNPQVNGLQGKVKPPTPRLQKKQKVNAS